MKKTLFYFCLFIVSSSALAYFTPPAYFYSQWAKEKASAILIKQERSFYDQGRVTQTINETIKVKRPNLYRREWVANSQEEIRVLGRSRAVAKTAGALTQVKMQDVILPHEAAIIYNKPSGITSAINQVGIDTQFADLDLMNQQPYLRVGSSQGNRIYISPKNEWMEAMFYQGRNYVFTYDLSKTQVFYPATIEIYKDQTLVEKVIVTSVNTSAKIADKEFDL